MVDVLYLSGRLSAKPWPRSGSLVGSSESNDA